MKHELNRIGGIVDRIKDEFSEGEDYEGDTENESSEADEVGSLGAGVKKINKDSDDEAEDDEEFFQGDPEKDKNKPKPNEPEKPLNDEKEKGLSQTMKNNAYEILLKEEREKNEIKLNIEPELTEIKEKPKKIEIQIQNSDLPPAVSNKPATTKKAGRKTSEANNFENTIGTNKESQGLKPSESKESSLDQRSVKRSVKRGLSRMTSKASMAIKRKGGARGGGGADSKIVSELQLNVKKLLEDVRTLKNFEHESGLTFKKIDKTFEELKLQNLEIVKQQDFITKRNDEIASQHQNAMDELKEKTKRVVKIYHDIQTMIDGFQKEYRYGFKKIIN